MRTLSLIGVLLTVASCASPGTIGRPGARVDVPSVGDNRAGTSSLTTDERIAILNHVWEERTRIVADGAFIASRSLHNITPDVAGTDARFAPMLRDALWGDGRSFEAQPPPPPRMRLWSVQQISFALADSVVVVARLTYPPREHRESFALAYREGRWSIRSLQIDSWGFY